MESKREWITKWGIVGLLLGVPFVYPDIWFISLLGVVLLFQSIDTSQSAKSVYFGAWYAFTIKYLFALGWFWTTYPIDWLSVEVGNIQIALIFFCWFTCGVALGLGGPFFVVLYRRLSALFKRNVFLLFVSTSLLWVVTEIAAAYSFAIVSIGPGGAVTPAFSFGYSGYLLAQHETFIQLARIAGVYGLSFMFMAIAFFLYRFFKNTHTKKARYILLGGLVACIAGGFISFIEHPQMGERSYSVAIIDTQFPLEYLRTEEGRAQTNRDLYEAVTEALEFDVDYILLPEDSRFFNQSLPVSTNKAVIRSRLGEVDAMIIDSGRFEQNGEKPVLQAFIYDGADGSVERVQKRYLVPQGEFLSSLSNLVLTLVGFGDTVEQVGEAIAFQVGPYTDQSELEVDTPGVLFCFESVDPLGVRKVLSERSEVPFMAHPISHAWFHEPTALWRQLDTMLRVQALWNETYIVSAGGHVAGGAYAPNGFVMSPDTIAEGEYWTVRVTEVPRI